MASKAWATWSPFAYRVLNNRLTESVDMAVWLGTSNAAGANLTVGTVPTHLQATDAGIKIWTGSAFATLENGVNNRPYGGSALWGQEAQYSYRYRQENPSKTLYNVKDAIGGSSLAVLAGADNDWAPANGELYLRLKTDILEAIASLEAEGKTVGTLTVFMMLGENDATVLAAANAFETNFMNFVTTFRNDIGLSNIVVIVGRITTAAAWTYSSTVRTAQANVVNAGTLMALVDTDDYTLQGDAMHYDAAAMVRGGNDIYNAAKGVRTLAWNPATDIAVREWWDPTNSFTLFTDTAGTTPAVPTNTVKRWSSLKGDVHLTEATNAPTLQTLSGRNAVRFTAASTQRLSALHAKLASRITGTNAPYTVVMLAKRGPAGASTTPLSFTRTDGSTNDSIRHYFGATNTVGIARTRSGNQQQQSSVAAAVASDIWYVVTWCFTGSTLIVRVNGVQVGSGALASGGAMVIDGVAFGALFDNVTNTWATPFDGALDEVIILNASAITSSVTSAESYLATKRV